jgi:regulator of cell morphogenesis and NO signaling
MKKHWKYDVSDSMCDLVLKHQRVMLLMSRMGIGLGFGEKTIRQTCEDHGVDPEAFVAIVNTIFGDDDVPAQPMTKSSIDGVLGYLISTHSEYLEDRLPAMKRGLIEEWEGPETDLSRALIRYFDDLVGEIEQHAHKEEKEVFPYIKSLVDGTPPPPPPDLSRLSAEHAFMASRLMELKRILIKYYPVREIKRLDGVLVALYKCEQDLVSHNRVEERLLTPIITSLKHKT